MNLTEEQKEERKSKSEQKRLAKLQIKQSTDINYETIYLVLDNGNSYIKFHFFNKQGTIDLSDKVESVIYIGPDYEDREMSTIKEETIDGKTTTTNVIVGKAAVELKGAFKLKDNPTGKIDYMIYIIPCLLASIPDLPKNINLKLFYIGITKLTKARIQELLNSCTFFKTNRSTHNLKIELDRYSPEGIGGIYLLREITNTINNKNPRLVVFDIGEGTMSIVSYKYIDSKETEPNITYPKVLPLGCRDLKNFIAESSEGIISEFEEFRDTRELNKAIFQNTKTYKKIDISKAITKGVQLFLDSNRIQEVLTFLIDYILEEAYVILTGGAYACTELKNQFVILIRSEIEKIYGAEDKVELVMKQIKSLEKNHQTSTMYAVVKHYKKSLGINNISS